MCGQMAVQPMRGLRLFLWRRPRRDYPPAVIHLTGVCIYNYAATLQRHGQRQSGFARGGRARNQHGLLRRNGACQRLV